SLHLLQLPLSRGQLLLSAVQLRAHRTQQQEDPDCADEHTEGQSQQKHQPFHGLYCATIVGHCGCQVCNLCGMSSATPLNVDLTGAPGPKLRPGAPLDGDPRLLWRVSTVGSPLQLSEISTRRRTGFDGKKRAGRRARAARADLLADLQELLWA